MKWNILALILILILASSCGFDKFNAQVERQNMAMLKIFADGMAKQNTEAGRLALALTFATGVGRQSLARPETAATYLPLINATVLPWIALFHGHSDDDVSQSYAAGRDLIFQSTIDDNSHSGNDLMSMITGNNNTNTQYVCPTCEGGTDEGEAGIQGFNTNGCRMNPPAGYSHAGTPLYSPGCSCTSHASGGC